MSMQNLAALLVFTLIFRFECIGAVPPYDDLNNRFEHRLREGKTRILEEEQLLDELVKRIEQKAVDAEQGQYGQDEPPDTANNAVDEEVVEVRNKLGPCAEKLNKVELILACSPGIVGLEKPLCDTDGNYTGMQFEGSGAYCVTKDGTPIPGYGVNRWETDPDMSCKCARDQYAYMQSGLIGMMFDCQPNGSYAKTQCVGSGCFCVDSQGNQIGTASVNIGQLSSLNCCAATGKGLP